MFKSFLLISITMGSLFSIKSIFLNPHNSEENYQKKIVNKNIKPVKEVIKQSRPIINIDYPKTQNTIEDILQDEIQSLLKKANQLTKQENYQEALKTYNEIIEKLKDTKDSELLKSFAGAYFFKAYIFKRYLQDNDEAIKAYNAVIQKFEYSDDVELLKLYYNAQTLKTYLLNRDDSIEVYNEIIKKFKDSDSVELLKKFSLAQLSKANLLSGEDTIEVYNEIIEKFRNSDHIELLKELSTAQFSKAYLLSEYFKNNKEAIEVYDEIIEKFKSYESDEFRQEVADALFAKSFLLMQEDGEASMEILDELIERYKNDEDRTISRNFEYSVINNIELALITNNDDSNYRELANQYLSNLRDTKPQLQMLDILKNAQDLNQDEAIEQWKMEYKDYQFENWSFEELKRWNNEMEESEGKQRIKAYLDEFIKHNNNHYNNHSSKDKL